MQQPSHRRPAYEPARRGPPRHSVCDTWTAAIRHALTPAAYASITPSLKPLAQAQEAAREAVDQRRAMAGNVLQQGAAAGIAHHLCGYQGQDMYGRQSDAAAGQRKLHIGVSQAPTYKPLEMMARDHCPYRQRTDGTYPIDPSVYDAVHASPPDRAPEALMRTAADQIPVCGLRVGPECKKFAPPHPPCRCAPRSTGGPSFTSTRTWRQTAVILVSIVRTTRARFTSQQA